MESFEGVETEDGKYCVSIGSWSETFDSEWEAVIVRDVKLLDRDGSASTNLVRSSVRDFIRRGGLGYLKTEAGAIRAEEMVRRAKVRLEGPLPQISGLAPSTVAAAKRRGRPVGKGRTKRRSSRFEGVYQSGERWQARVGRRYVGTSDDERVAALIRDVGALEQTLTDLNYPLEFVEEALNYGAKGLQKIAILALFINRLDDELAKVEVAQEMADAGPGEPVVEPGAETGTDTEGAPDE